MRMIITFAGNRVLMLLEGKAGAYIRDTGGFAKWDTSGTPSYMSAVSLPLLRVTIINRFISNCYCEQSITIVSWLIMNKKFPL
jgi:hypothetical protein